VNDEPPNIGPDQLDALRSQGTYDPDAKGAADRLELIRFALELGATLDEVKDAQNLGELALDVRLRPRGTETLTQVAEAAGAELSVAQLMMTALGLPSDPDRILTDGEAGAVRLFAGVSGSALGQEVTIQLARVVGNAMARVAETLVGAFRLRVELPQLDAGTRYFDVVKAYVDMADSLLPSFVRTLDTVIRDQIVVAAERMWSTDIERSAVTLPRTVGFVDLVGYTETTASLTVRELTQVLVDFDQRTAEVVARGNGQIVKTIGDEVMFVTQSAADACQIALDLADGAGGRLAPVRVGIATGEMVSVLGDLYGPDVNLAARLVVAAEPCTVVASEAVRAAAPGFGFDALPPLDLKGFPGPVIAYRVHT
jgi:class 3 adenylate cyclase